MAKRIMRKAAIIHGTSIVNVLVLPPDEAADDWLANYDGVCVVADPEDEYQETFLTLTGCVAVEITGMGPQPGISADWSYENGVFTGPPEPEPWVDPDATV